MLRDDLCELPYIALPAGYLIRTFRKGEQQAWERIIQQSFGSETSFAETMMADRCYLPQRVHFVCCGGQAVGTASAWVVPGWGARYGFLHYVGVTPRHQGKGLGFQVSLAALRSMRAENKTAAVLTTDDFRLAAIGTYLRLGFRPLLVHENQRDRWRAVLAELQRPELMQAFAKYLEGSVFTK